MAHNKVGIWLTCIDKFFNIIDAFKYSCFAESDGHEANKYDKTSGGSTYAFQISDKTAGIVKNVHKM